MKLKKKGFLCTSWQSINVLEIGLRNKKWFTIYIFFDSFIEYNGENCTQIFITGYIYNACLLTNICIFHFTPKKWCLKAFNFYADV